MPRSLKVVLLIIVAVAILGMGVFWDVPLHPAGAQDQTHADVRTLSANIIATQTRRPLPTASGVVTQTHSPISTITKQQLHPSPTPIVVKTPGPSSRNAQAQGPYTVKGNTIFAADGKPYLFHGIGRDSLEYSCRGDGHFDAQELGYMGSGTNRNGVAYWGANTVRLPLSEGIWLNGQTSQGCSAAQYQTLIKQTVDTLTVLKLNVILDLQWSDAGGQSLQGGGPWAMPDADSVTFWQQVAGLYKSYNNVLFELFNEPHPQSWSCWVSPCTITDTGYSDDCHCVKTLTFASAGMQALVDAVRNTGAANLVLVAGMDWGFDLSQISTYPITGANVVYDTHPYPYSEKQPNSWDAAFGTISKQFAVVSAENGEYDCGTNYMSQLLSYFDAHGIGWIAWAWVAIGSPCGYPQLIQNYTGQPVPGMGQLIYARLRGYV